MKFQVRVLSGLRPDKKLFRDAEQIAMLQYARSNTIDSEWRREGEVREFGLCNLSSRPRFDDMTLCTHLH